RSPFRPPGSVSTFSRHVTRSTSRRPKARRAPIDVGERWSIHGLGPCPHSAPTKPRLRADEGAPGTIRNEDGLVRPRGGRAPGGPGSGRFQVVDLGDGAASFGTDESEPGHRRSRGRESFGEQALPRSRGKGRKLFRRHLETEVAGSQAARLTGRGR